MSLRILLSPHIIIQGLEWSLQKPVGSWTVEHRYLKQEDDDACWKGYGNKGERRKNVSIPLVFTVKTLVECCLLNARWVRIRKVPLREVWGWQKLSDCFFGIQNPQGIWQHLSFAECTLSLSLWKHFNPKLFTELRAMTPEGKISGFRFANLLEYASR